MADFVFQTGKGKIAEYAARVEANDPTNAAFIIVVIDANGDTDATMKDRDTLDALLGGTCNEVTNTNYARKTLANGALTITTDDTNDRVDIDFADQTWSAVAAGTAWTDLIVCYDSDTTGGADSAIIPLTCHDFVVVPDGADITCVLNASGFFRAS